MDYSNLIKRIQTPAGFDPPRTLVREDIVASALTREHLAEDVAGINASLELIRATRGGMWPTEPVSEDGNYLDLVWHECEFRDHKSFTYVVHNADGEYLGCCYLYPVGSRTPLSAELIDRDVDVSWWVTPAGYEGGYYERLYRALQCWITDDFPFVDPHFSNTLIPT